MKTGIENLKVLIGFGLTLGQKSFEVLADGKLEFAETIELLGVARDVPQVIEAIKRAPDELADLDPGEQAQLYKEIQTKFDLENETVEKAVEVGLRTTLTIVAAVYEVRELLPKAA